MKIGVEDEFLKRISSVNCSLAKLERIHSSNNFDYFQWWIIVVYEKDI